MLGLSFADSIEYIPLPFYLLPVSLCISSCVFYYAPYIVTIVAAFCVSYHS